MRTTLSSLSSRNPDQQVLKGHGTGLTASQIEKRIVATARQFSSYGIKRLGLHLDNGPQWVISDLACQTAGLCAIPVPTFFSANQLVHTLKVTGADALLSDTLEDLPAELCGRRASRTQSAATLWHIDIERPPKLPVGTGKITFTSGSTGTPRGVCLNNQMLLDSARSLTDLVATRPAIHLCLLPLSTLLENVAGVYAPLFAGGTVVAPALSDIGLTGSSGLNLKKMIATINEVKPHSIILVPELLSALTLACEQGWTPPASLELVAVGGGKVSTSLIERAMQQGLPVYEGYGLSECQSVVTLNRPGASRPGSVGRTLPGRTVSIRQGEIIVRGKLFLGYLDEPDSWYPEYFETGDLGTVDEKGFLHIHGRKKSQLISSFGRNISPEWIESEILASPLISECVVFGDARPHLTAIITSHEPATPDTVIDQWIDSVNTTLPDYARIQAWLRPAQRLRSYEHLMTDNGRPRRQAIERHFACELEELYNPQPMVLAK